MTFRSARGTGAAARSRLRCGMVHAAEPEVTLSLSHAELEREYTSNCRLVCRRGVANEDQDFSTLITSTGFFQPMPASKASMGRGKCQKAKAMVTWRDYSASLGLSHDI